MNHKEALQAAAEMNLPGFVTTEDVVRAYLEARAEDHGDQDVSGIRARMAEGLLADFGDTT